jgi:predicted GNAT family N-acyltransferase
MILSNVQLRKPKKSEINELCEFAKLSFIETFKDQYKSKDLIDLTNEMFTFENMNLHLDTTILCVSNSGETEQVVQDGGKVDPLGSKGTAEIIGYVQYQLHDASNKVPFTNTFEIKRFYIAKEYFGTGISHLLIKKCLEAKQDKRVWLGVFTKNYRAMKFYRKYGFDKIGEYCFSEKILKDGSKDIDEIWLMKE